MALGRTHAYAGRQHLTIGVALLAALHSAPASAQGSERAEAPAAPVSCATAACARAAFQRGVAAYQDKDYAAAIQHFRAALSVKRHPSVLLNLGLAEQRAGMPVEAIAHLLEVEADSAASSELRASAQDARAGAERDSARVSLEQGDGVSLSVDGQRVAAGERGLRVNPGKHQLRVTRDGAVIEREVNLASGETLRISLDRAREMVLVMPKRDSAAQPRDSGTGKPLDPLWFYVGLGTVVVVGGLATWSAIDTQRAFDDYERDLPRLSQAEINERVASGHAEERRTNWLIGGGVFAGVATGLLAAFFVDWSSGAHARSSQPTTVSASLGPGVGGVRFGGSF